MGTSMVRLMEKLILVGTVIFLHCFKISVDGFLCSTIVSNPVTRQKLHPKSILLHIHSKDECSSDRNETDHSFRNHVETNKIRSIQNVQHQEIIFPGCSASPLLDRRTMTSVAAGRTLAMIFAGSVTSAALMETLPSQAAMEENSGKALPKLSLDDNLLPTANDIVDLPLEYIPTLGAYVVRYFLFGEAFSAIVDTGSPFLTVPCYCKPYRNRKMFWGCYKPELTRDSGYGNTIEGFDNNYGTVVWRKADFSFSPTASSESSNTNAATAATDVVFGVLDRDLLNGSGGVFFGLIKETDRWIRPSFMGQTGYTSFCVDLRRNNGTSIMAETNENNNQLSSMNPRLVLSKQSMVGTGKWRKNDEKATENEDWIPLVRDLKKKYGAPVVHYTAKASHFVVNGLPLLINKKKPLYVIFDTGVSGMVVSQELFDGRYLQARKNREKSLWGDVQVSFATNTGKTITLSAKKPITTPLGKATPWKGFRGNLICVGLAFLDGFATTVDVDDGKILFVEG